MFQSLPRPRSGTGHQTGRAGARILALFTGLMALVFSAAFTAPAHAQTLRIVALGDSLTAGYGLAAGEGFTDRLEAALRASGHDVVIVNAGVSGDTATGGAERLDWTLAEGADAVIVELGANDALRGVDPAVTEAALADGRRSWKVVLNRRGGLVYLTWRG